VRGTGERKEGVAKEGKLTGEEQGRGDGERRWAVGKSTGTRLCFLCRFPLKKMYDVIRFWRPSSSISEHLHEGLRDHQCRRFVRFLHKHLCLFFFLGCATFPTVLRQFFGSNVVHFDICGVLADANIGDFLWSANLLSEAVCGFNIDLLWRIDFRCSYPRDCLRSKKNRVFVRWPI
jgi:hypothetical protein